MNHNLLGHEFQIRNYNKDIVHANHNFLGDRGLGLHFFLELIDALFGKCLFLDREELLIMALYHVDKVLLSMLFLENLFLIRDFFDSLIVLRIKIGN